MLKEVWFQGIPQKGPSDDGAVGNIARLPPMAKVPEMILRIPAVVGFHVLSILLILHMDCTHI